MDLQIGDIVRFKFRKGQKDGLHEITGVYRKEVYLCSVTNDECNTEYYAKIEDLIYVCSVKDRQDI